MFSNQIILRGGELPHMIFDCFTGEFLDVAEGMHIGNHVWIGEQSYINKRSVIPDGCIVGAKAVVTKKFSQKNCVIAGNPAKIVKKHIRWFRNFQTLEENSIYYKGWLEYKKNLCSES